MHRSASASRLENGSMKIRRTNSVKSYSKSYGSYSGQPQPNCRGKLRAVSFYLLVFASGCLMTTVLLNLAPQHTLDTRLKIQPEHGAGTRRALYTAGTGGMDQSV
jgi:hypothetical protein